MLRHSPRQQERVDLPVDLDPEERGDAFQTGVVGSCSLFAMPQEAPGPLAVGELPVHHGHYAHRRRPLVQVGAVQEVRGEEALGEVLPAPVGDVKLTGEREPVKGKVRSTN